jgi:thioredoxin 1
MTVTAVTDSSFATDVLAHAGVVVVDIWAEWCTPCRALVPIFTALAATYAGRVRILKLDADANVEVVSRYEIRALPTVLIFQGGVLVDRISGAQPMAHYTSAIDARLQQLAAPGGGTVAPLAPSAYVADPVVVPPDEESQARALLDSRVVSVVFKHSSSCPVSFTAKRQLEQFAAEHPDVPTRTVVVQMERGLSNALAMVSRIRHETPQVFLVQNGRVLWDASHGAITRHRLAAALSSVLPPG